MLCRTPFSSKSQVRKCQETTGYATGNGHLDEVCSPSLPRSPIIPTRVKRPISPETKKNARATWAHGKSRHVAQTKSQNATNEVAKAGTRTFEKRGRGDLNTPRSMIVSRNARSIAPAPTNPKVRIPRGDRISSHLQFNFQARRFSERKTRHPTVAAATALTGNLLKGLFVTFNLLTPMRLIKCVRPTRAGPYTAIAPAPEPHLAAVAARPNRYARRAQRYERHPHLGFLPIAESSTCDRTVRQG